MRLDGSIHPQGWVPIETVHARYDPAAISPPVAFTPKGGCPLKLYETVDGAFPTALVGSIHPQGWVPIETRKVLQIALHDLTSLVAFTPKGGCPLKPLGARRRGSRPSSRVAFTPKGGCPLKRGASGGRASEAKARGVAFTPKGGCPLKLNAGRV